MEESSEESTGRVPVLRVLDMISCSLIHRFLHRHQNNESVLILSHVAGYFFFFLYWYDACAFEASCDNTQLQLSIDDLIKDWD